MFNMCVFCAVDLRAQWGFNTEITDGTSLATLGVEFVWNGGVAQWYVILNWFLSTYFLPDIVPSEKQDKVHCNSLL